MCTVFAEKEGPEINQFVVDPNEEGLIFDFAVHKLKTFCKNELKPKQVESVKFHANTWGLSSNNFFGETIIPKMKKLREIDLSDTIKYRHRSDMPLGVNSMLKSAIDYKVERINLSDNFLDHDGARSFKVFFESNSTLKIFNASNCSLGDASGAIIEQALSQNSRMQLTELYLQSNNIG